MKAFLVPFVMSLGLVLAAGNPSMAASQTKSTTQTTTTTTTGHVNFKPPPRAHANYECANGTCTCTGQKDCSYMNSDGVCKEGTYNNGSCVAKEQ